MTDWRSAAESDLLSKRAFMPQRRSAFEEGFVKVSAELGGKDKKKTIVKPGSEK